MEIKRISQREIKVINILNFNSEMALNSIINSSAQLGKLTIGLLDGLKLEFLEYQLLLKFHFRENPLILLLNSLAHNDLFNHFRK